MKHKLKKLLLMVLAAVLGLSAIVILGARIYFRAPVKDYYSASVKGFKIPGLRDGFVPQGICYDEETSMFFVTGYQKDGSASPIYLVDQKTGKTAPAAARLYGPDGTAYTGHAGGLSVYGRYVCVADGHDACLYVFEKEAVAAGGPVQAVGTFPITSADDRLGPAFTALTEDQLIVGEFYYEPDYPTADAHKHTTRGGDYSQALALVYDLDDTAEFGIAPEPSAVMTLPDRAQGMVLDGDHVYVSTSWGISRSVIYDYSLSRAETGETLNAMGKELPRYDLDSSSLLASHEIAPMSEELAIVSNHLYVMCESASNKYIFGKFTSGQWCYATDLTRW